MKIFFYLRVCKIVLIVFLFGFFIFNPVAGQESLRIFGNSYKAPKIYSLNGEAKGILPDILRYIDGEMEGHRFDIRLFPWARAYNYALQGMGGIVGLSKTREREKIFDYSDPLYYDEVLMVVLKGNEFAFDTMEDLKGKRVGIGLKGSYGQEFEKSKGSGFFIVDEDSGPVFRLKKLLRERIDVALISPGLCAFYQTIQQDGELLERKDAFSILPQPFLRDPNYLGFLKKMNKLPFLRQFNDELEEGLESGELGSIIHPYHDCR